MANEQQAELQPELICPICMEAIAGASFTTEHIVPKALGSTSAENTIRICKKCNSLLGSIVDIRLTEHPVVVGLRYEMKILGRNGLPNPFGKRSVHYDKTPITGSVSMDRNGDFVRFKADCKVIPLQNGMKIVCGPRKHICGYANQYLRDKGLPPISQNEIDQHQLHITKKQPHYIGIDASDAEIEESLVDTCPAIIKIAYEATYRQIGYSYLADETAAEIRCRLGAVLAGEETFIFPTDMSIAYQSVLRRRYTAISFYQQENQLIARVLLLGAIQIDVCVSNDYLGLELQKHPESIIVFDESQY